MNSTTLRQKLSYISQYAPVRRYFVWFALCLCMGWWWVMARDNGAEGAAHSILLLLIKLAAAFTLSLLLLGFLSVLVPFLMFRIKAGQGQVLLTTGNLQASGTSLVQNIELSVSPLLQPPLGFLHYRFVYNGGSVSDKFSISKKGFQKTVFQTSQTGTYNWHLPAIREYQIEQLIVYFGDIFQFFSFSKKIAVKQAFFTKPTAIAIAEQNIAPQKTENEQIRIEELRRVEGEFLSYKNFENNDDVRRIVWKIFAKNKELVVRIPENLDPFASHIYFYCSFHNGSGMPLGAALETRGLNRFKNACWGVYQQILKQGGAIKFVPDQEFTPRHFSDAEKQTEYAIAVSEWQQNNSLCSYVVPKNASLICVQSLNDATDLERLLGTTGPGITVVLVKLSRGMAKTNIVNWLRWIFFREEKNEDTVNTFYWKLSAMRRAVLKNEKKLETIVKNSEAKLLLI